MTAFPTVTTGLIVLLFVATAVLLLTCLMHEERRAMQADRRADLLVRELLTGGELSDLERSGYLEVPSRIVPGRIYRVPEFRGSVRVVDGGSPAGGLCLQPTDEIPPRELVLLHKLMLEGAEADYLRIANRVP
jgi:hypothetical protein